MKLIDDITSRCLRPQMSIVISPRHFRRFAHMDAFLDERLGSTDGKARHLPAVFAQSGVCPVCQEPTPPDGPDAPLGMTSKELVRAGRTNCLCPNCQFPIRRWKRNRKDAPACRHCKRPVPEASDNTVAVVCAPCASHRATLCGKGLLRTNTPERFCPDCGGERPKGYKRCDACAGKRRRAMARARLRRHRAGAVAL